MPSCCAFGCPSSQPDKANHREDLQFHRFPSDQNCLKQWAVKVNRLDSCGQLWKPTNASRLCSAHFEEECYETRVCDGRKMLKKGSIPTKFSHKGKLTVPRKRPFPRNDEQEQSAGGKKKSHQTDHTYFLANSSAAQDDDVDEVCLSDSNTHLTCQQELNQVKYQYRKQQLANERLQNSIRTVFNQDQIDSFQRKGSQGMSWSEATIRKSLQTKFACGKTGYQLLIDQGMPLPSIKTLQRRLKEIPFHSGILPTVFQLLKIKVEKMKPNDRYCSLTLDEMALQARTEYDTSSGMLLGHITLPGHSGIATHALVFMLSGLCVRWKQTVAFYYTGNSTDGSVFHDIILEIIKKAHDVGLFVINVTSDMGASNQAMWRSFGVGVTRSMPPRYFITHPCNADRRLFFMADVPHALKNLKTALCKGEFKLKEKVFSIKPVEMLARRDNGRELKLAPKLKLADLRTGHFGKMKVSTAAHVFSNAVASSLKYIIQNDLISDESKSLAENTAWFISKLNHWFDLMSSRHPGLALSRSQITKYDEAIRFLNETVDLIGELTIGRGQWKPVQTAIILSTLTVIDLSDEILAYGLPFLLTSRLSQGCLENLFSTVRLKSSAPSPIEFRNALKIVTVSQFLKTPANTSYELDDSEYLGDYLEK